MRLQPWTTRLRRRNTETSGRPTGELPAEVKTRLYDSLSNLYTKLDPLRHEVRIVTVDPGQFEEAITCTLQLASLLENPHYEALSYAWGDHRPSRSIYINGVRYSVSENLESAIRHLRYKDKPRTLWIDAICINQTDISERNSQVRLMGTIYAKSTEVLAYLGPEYNDSDLAFDFFQTMPTDLSHHWDPETYPELRSVYTLDHTIAVNDLFERAWWQRVWTVQESVLCPKLRIICGPRQLPAEQFFKVGKCYFKHLYTCCQDTWYEIFHSTAGQPGLGDVCTALAKLGDMRDGTEKLKFGNIISKFMSRSCSDPHDKLYGFLGFASEEEAALIIPDYSRPIPDVYEEVAFGLMQCSNSLDLLSMRLPIVEGDADSAVRELPSWVPDWRQDSDATFLHDIDDRLCSLHRYNATHNSKCKLSSPAPGQLSVRGKFISRIATLSTEDNHMESNSLSDFFKAWQELAGVVNNPQQMYARSRSTTLENAFWQTLCCSLMPDREHPRKSALLQRTSDHSYHKLWYSAWWEWCEKYNCEPAKLMNIQSEYTRAEINLMGGWISTSINMRRLFISDDPGWMGLVPVDARIGDEIVLLEGGRVPYILRRVSGDDLKSQEDLYQFVGAAYVHGIMDGSQWSDNELQDIILT